MGGSFVGSIAGVLIGGELFRFTTYTGARLTHCASWTGGASVRLEDRDYRLAVELDGAAAAPLVAPLHGKMVARADESLDATMKVRLERRSDGAVLLSDTGLHGGCEVMDERGELGKGVFRADGGR
jgi:hypothetical protein